MIKDRTTIAPETESSKTRVARNVYTGLGISYVIEDRKCCNARYKDAELARFVLLEEDSPPPLPPPPFPPPPPGNAVEDGCVGGSVAEKGGNDDMTKGSKGQL
jgi:hypothetical protein